MKNMGQTEKEFLKLLGCRVRDFRNAFDVSQERLAELAHVHPTYISNIENAKANASIGIYRRIAKGLEVPLPQLVDVAQAKAEKDHLVKLFLDIRSLGKREQKVVIETIKGLLTGMKG